MTESHRPPARPRSFLAKPLTLAALALAICPNAGQAVVVTVAGNDYDISIQSTSYLDDPSLFQLPPAGRMPWWGDSTGTSASVFAQVVYNQLGVGPTAGYGPLFAYDLSGGTLNAILQELNNPLIQLDDTFPDNQPFAYAVASPLATPTAPSPLPIAALPTAGAWSRTLRRRIRSRGAAAPDPSLRPPASTL